MKKQKIKPYLLGGTLTIGLVAAILFSIPASMPPFLDEEGNVLPGSIAAIEAIDLNGVEQWLFIRGKDVNKPVLLFLHGGPGTPETPFLTHYNQSLAEDFVLVSWEQRGAGKSYSATIPPESMTMDQFIADTHALTQYLKERFGREKIYLVGHSWGTLLGIRTVHQYPDDYHAFVAIAQTADAAREAELIYDWVYRQAQADNNRRALRQLEKIGPPAGERIALSDLSLKLKWVNHYGGAAFYGRNGFWPLVGVVLRSPVYTFRDKLTYLKGEQFSLRFLYQEINSVNLFAEIEKIAVPIYFVHGRHDYQVPLAIAEDYFHHLQAPYKQFIVFENSAHGVLFEEPEKFRQTMRMVVGHKS
jgi:pimeloyl-ACP methyl ester carboxylesterase